MGILVRSGPLAHPEVQKAIMQYCVPVVFEVRRALPSWVDVPGLGDPEAEQIAADPEDDPEVAAFLKIHQQEPMSQGIWIVTPDLKLLRTSYQTAPDPMYGTILAAVRDWKSEHQADPLPLPKEAYEVDWPETSPCPPEVMRIKVYGRLLDGRNFEPFRDDVDIPKSRWRSVLPEQPVVGQVVALPEPLARQFASRLYSGEIRLRLRPEEIKEVSLRLEVTAVEGQRARGTLEGHARIEGASSFNFRRRREFEGRFRGELEWDVAGRSVERLLLVADGLWRAEYPQGTTDFAAYDVYPAQQPATLEWSKPMRMLFLFEYPPVYKPKASAGSGPPRQAASPAAGETQHGA